MKPIILLFDIADLSKLQLFMLIMNSKKPACNILAALCLTLVGFVANAQQLIKPPLTSEIWTKDYEPFRIVGNLYYVGTFDLACYLITTPKGHILINTGLAEAVPMIKKH